MANEKKPDNAPVQTSDAAPPADDIAALKAQLAALAAENAKLKSAPQIPAELLAMTGVDAGTRNARPETGAIPLHFTGGHPVFKAERPTGKAG